MAASVLVLLSSLVISAHAQSACSPSEPCPDGFDCHPFKGLCVKEPETITDRPSVWLDETEDKCKRTSSDCAIFGLDPAGTHPRGRGDTWCKEGEIVRCKAPEAPPVKITDVTELKVLTYNVWERAFWVTNDGQRERTCRIPQWIAANHPDIDVIGLQEVFMGGCFADQLDMRALFCHYGLCHSTPTVDNPDFAQPGGMFVVSRWPIVARDQLVYENAREGSADFFAAKGVSYAKIRKSVGSRNRNYHVMTTHLQAGGQREIREAQAGEWGHWVMSKKLPRDEAVIMCGDLNVDWYKERDQLNVVLANLGAVIPEVVGPMNVTSDPTINDVNDGGGSGWIDWVLYRKDHLLPVTATQMALYPTSDVKFPACWCELCITLDRKYVWPEDADCRERRLVRHLSDHFPVLGAFTFK